MKEKQKGQRTKKNHKLKSNLREKGITLIALVVTIIILLILAGVAIASVTGDNGLFRKAREATNMYKDAERDEQGVLGEAENEISKLLNPSGNGENSGGDSTDYATGNTPVTVSDGTYYIPDGFKLAEDSGKTINEGIVVEDKNGNQWVWIPCYVEGGVGADAEGRVKYDRYAYDNQIFSEDKTKIYMYVSSIDEVDENTMYCTESLDPTDEASIREFGGYYIGRYEAGNKEWTEAKVMYGENNETHTVTIKKGQAPYRYVTLEKCITLSTGIANANNYNSTKMYTKLCSSYAWDTAIKFIEKEHPQYGSTSQDKSGNYIGNYMDLEFQYTNLEGKNKTKCMGSPSEMAYEMVPTGQTTAVKKIYDMGGNAGECTSEDNNSVDIELVTRGGTYRTSSERSWIPKFGRY